MIGEQDHIFRYRRCVKLHRRIEYDFGFMKKHIDETIRILNRNKE